MKIGERHGGSPMSVAVVAPSSQVQSNDRITAVTTNCGYDERSSRFESFFSYDVTQRVLQTGELKLEA